ncbi:MAG TPA: hypothetical protein VGQ53_01570 [Chitinophagaceae bacterium]|jgi:hypothetical protein|nr:hypothetical protein [Chitinophagaceae bacterium]
MEVHHHPKVEKKKFKEYFLEFLMIFLAVTMGFFAETIRESISEHQRAREFAESLLQDLREDTAQLRSYRDYVSYAAGMTDTLQQLLSDAQPAEIPSGKLYWYGLFGGAFRDFAPNDETFQQMKSTGSLRYFNRRVASAAAKYDRFCRIIQSNELRDRNIYTEVRKLRAQLFDFKYNEIANTIYATKFTHFNYSRLDSFIRSDPPLLTKNKALFNQYVELVRSRFLRLTVLRYTDSTLNQANILISELKNEYHFKDE